jgi:hypothetical protein
LPQFSLPFPPLTFAGSDLGISPEKAKRIYSLRLD